jgi:hypothetical protein
MKLSEAVGHVAHKQAMGMRLSYGSPHPSGFLSRIGRGDHTRGHGRPGARPSRRNWSGHQILVAQRIRAQRTL